MRENSIFRVECPCGRRAQKLRLFEGRPVCGHCVRAAGMQYRSDMCSHFSKRTALTAPKRIERLNSDTRGLVGHLIVERTLSCVSSGSLVVERRPGLRSLRRMLRKP